MASSPISTASSSDLYAASEPIEENAPTPPEEVNLHAGQVSTLATGNVSPAADMSSKVRTLSEEKRLWTHRHQSPGDLGSNLLNGQHKRKRDPGPETCYSAEAGPKPQEHLVSGSGQNPAEDDGELLSKRSQGIKRTKMNGHLDAESKSRTAKTQVDTLPPELWHHVFRFVPPVFLGRLLRVNRAFHSYLTSPPNGSKLATASSRTGVRPLDSETIWAASRRRFAAGLPKPLRGLRELDMWRLLRGQTCQLCGTTKISGATFGNVNPWESGPGEQSVRVIWSFGIRCCGPCLEKSSEKEVDLLLSSECPSILLPALPFAFVSSSMHYIPNTLLRETAAPPSTRIVKRYYKPHVQQIKQELEKVKELGAASAQEWNKGLPEEGRERINDTIRWEQWEARGGLKKVNLRPQVKTVGSSTSLNTTRDQPKPRDVDPHGSALQPAPSNLNYNNVQVPNTVMPPADSYQYPQHPTMYHAPWINTGPFHNSPVPQLPPQMPTVRPERTIKDINEAKAARRAEIERRCSLFDPPLLPNILSHMESFQAAIQIPTPLADTAWELLKPRLLSQRANAEKREQEQVQQNELLQSESKQRRHQETQSKDSKESIDRHWDSVQAPVRDKLSVLADAAIDERWLGGRAVTKENSPKFAADVLLYVRQRFYDDIALANGTAAGAGQLIRSDPPNGPSTQTLTLENMKWLFDTKVKPFTEHFQRELFLCNGCDDNFKFYGFEGVIQHYAAKHTSSLSMGSVVVYWRAEWPEEPPFNPEPSPSKSAHYKVPSPGAGGSSAWNSVEQQGLNPSSGYRTSFEAGPKQPGNGSFAHTNTTYHGSQTAPYSDTSHMPVYNQGYHPATVSSTMPDGFPNPLIHQPPHSQLQQWQGNNSAATSTQTATGYEINSPYHAYGYQNGYSPHGIAPGTAYGTQQSFRAPPARPPHFDPSRNHAAQLTEGYQHQMDEMAKQARDVWHGTSNIRNLPASVRIYVVIRHVAARFSEKFSTVPSLAMFLDGLDNNAQMRPVRSLNGLACKTCVTQHNTIFASNLQSQPPASDRRLYTLPHLLNHFRTIHLEGPQAFANPNSGPDGPRYDWTCDMIELPESHLIADLVHSAGMDDDKLELLAWAFPHVFPSPLPRLSTLRSGPIPGHREVPSASYFKDDYSQGRNHQPSISADQTRDGSRPVFDIARPSELPGEDEYDPHKPAYQSNAVTAGSGIERTDIYEKHLADYERNKPEWHQPSYEHQIPETTDLSKLILSATQMRPVRGPPMYREDQHQRPPAKIPSSAYLSYERGEDASVRGITDTTRQLGSDDYYDKLHAAEDNGENTIRNDTHDSLASANVRAAEQFLRNFGQVSDIEAKHGSQTFEPDNWRKSVNDRVDSGSLDAVEAKQYSTKSLDGEDYRLIQPTHDISPDSSTLVSRPVSRNARITNAPQVQNIGMYSQTNYHRAASNALINDSDSASNGRGLHTYSDHPTHRRTAVEDRYSGNGYSIERPESNGDALRIAHYWDRPRSPITIPVDSRTYYRSRSPIQEVQPQPVYRIRSPLGQRESHGPRTYYEYSRPDRYEVVENHEYAPNSQERLPQRIEYVPVRTGNQAPPNSSRYIIAQPMDSRGQPDYVRVEGSYDHGAIYERDGQLYRSEPRAYQAPLSRGNAGSGPSYAY